MAPKKKQEKPTLSKDTVDLILADLNKTMRGAGRIDRGDEINWLDLPRIRSGILGLDVVSSGGIPVGAMTQFWGPYSAGKTTTVLHAMREEQMRGKQVCFGAGEGFNKSWARKNGLWIPFAEDEYANADAETRKKMEAYDEVGEERGWGSVSVAQHIHGDGLLEVIAQLVKANVFSLIAIDSLAVLKPARALDEQEIGEETMGGGGQVQMLGRFCARITAALNTRYKDSGEVDMGGPVPNTTAVVALNQARIKMGGGGRPGQVMYQPVGGEQLKHTFALSLEFSKGEQLGEMMPFDGGRQWTTWGQEIRIKGHKSKVGPDQRRASWDLYTSPYETFVAGQIDTAKEIRVWGVYYGIIEQAGAWFTLPDGTRAQGKEGLENALRENKELAQGISDMVIEQCKQSSI